MFAAEVPRPEHPDPQRMRDTWLNLNGPWQFEEDPDNTGEARSLTEGKGLAGTIVVPFCPESGLSGIGKTDFMKYLWYRRTFEVPGDWRGRRVLLHFGAVDWRARVWLNGRYLGQHEGGYTPFQFEITPHLRPSGNEVVVSVFDDTRSGSQATGKQSHDLKSSGCVYTRTTGIWQTVWLEAVGDTCLSEFTITPAAASKQIAFQGDLDGPTSGLSLRLSITDQGKPVGAATFPAARRVGPVTLSLSKVHLWSPEDPFLYGLDITLLDGDKSVDTVHSYFGMREVRIEGNRFLLNGKPVFQRLVLDQGFYPQGIYTAPSDEALKRDIELSLAAGFNGARLHQKVFEPRLLYWADKLGYLLWGEYPNWGFDHSNPKAQAQMLAEWLEEVARDRNHPSIIGWCPLNETGGGEGVAQLQRMLAVTRQIDPSRPFLDTSGYVHLVPETDVYDCHDYDQNPESFRSRYALFGLTGESPFNNNLSDPRSAYRGQPYFVSEYGGMFVKTEKSPGGGWGYGQVDLKAFMERYRGLAEALLENPNVCGFCYTQLTDIEQEQNGIYFYDRSPKYDVKLIAAINRKPAAYEKQGPQQKKVAWVTLCPTSRQERQLWRMTTTDPGQQWFEPTFDDTVWKEAPGGFGAEGTPGAVIGTLWTGSDIWLRRHFKVELRELSFAALEIHHDEDAEVYLNGQLAAKLTGYTTNYTLALATKEIRKALRSGDNLLAVHCHQTVGGQFIDVGLRVAVERDR